MEEDDSNEHVPGGDVSLAAIIQTFVSYLSEGTSLTQYIKQR